MAQWSLAMRTANARASRRFVLALLAGFGLALAGATPLFAEKTKSLSGKIRRVEGNLITIKKSGLVGSKEVEVHLTDDTKKHGQIAPGMHIKVKYREEKTAEGETRLIAVEVEARPEFASKNAKKLQKRDP
jgi:hypothetical protein